MKFEKVTSLVQTFPEICKYSCSRNNEVRNFSLYKQYYSLQIGKFNFKLLESLKLDCQNCGWTGTVPGNFARKVFKHGLKSNVLIKYAKNPWLKSRFLNLFGSIWRVWLASLAVLICLVIFRFYSDPVQISTPEVLSVEQAKSSKYQGKIVTIEGIVDYPLALTKDVEKVGTNGNVTTLSSEVYLPIFSQTDSTSFIVIRGGDSDLQNVIGRASVNNQELLNDQAYSVTGRIEPIENLKNNDLTQFFTVEIPKDRNLNPSTVLINSADTVTLQNFLLRYASLGIILTLLLILSIITQAYIDQKIVSKV